MPKPIAECSVVVAANPGSTAAPEIARAFAAAEADVVMAMNVNGVEATRLTEMREVDGCPVRFVDPRDVQLLVDELTAGSRGLDVWINDFPVAAEAIQAEEMESEAWSQILESTLSATFWCCQAAGRAMLKQGAGTIVNVLSPDAYVASAGSAAISAAMAGLDMVTKTLAVEWGGHGVRVVGVAGLRPAIEGPAQRIPLRRQGSAAELAQSILFLAGPEADYVNGEVLPVDGGWSSYQLF